MNCKCCSFGTRRGCSIFFSFLFFVITAAACLISADIMLIGMNQRNRVKKCSLEYDPALVGNYNYINGTCTKNSKSNVSFMKFFAYPGCDISTTVNTNTYQSNFIFSTFEWELYRKKLIDSYNEVVSENLVDTDESFTNVSLNDLINNADENSEALKYFNTSGYYYNCPDALLLQEPYLYKMSKKDFPVMGAYVGGITCVCIFGLVSLILLILSFKYTCCSRGSVGSVPHRSNYF